MTKEKSIAILVRDPLKKNRLSFETGYWRYSEYLISQRLLKEQYNVQCLEEKDNSFLWKVLKFFTKREWKAEYILSLFQTALFAFKRRGPSVAIAWQGPGYVFAAIRKMLGRTHETRLFVFIYYGYSSQALGHVFTRFILGKILKNAGTIICIASSQVEEFATSLKLDRSQIIWIPKGVDTEFFNSKDLIGESQDRYIFCAGDFDRDDELMFRACKSLNIKLVRVTKEPDYADELLNLARRLDVSSLIEVKSKVDAKTLRSLYQNSLFVLISLKPVNHPAGLTSLLETMACGKAVVVTKGLTSEDYIQDMTNGILAEQGNIKDVINKMTLLLGDLDLRSRLGSNARRSVEEKFLIQRDVDALMKIIQ